MLGVSLIGIGGLQAPELLIILAIVIVLFGATRLGDIGKGIGRGIREFRREVRDEAKDDKKRPEDDKEPAVSDEKQR